MNQRRRRSEQDKHVPREHLYNQEDAPPSPFLPVANVDLQSGVSVGGQIATFRGSAWDPPPSPSLSSDPHGSNGPGQSSSFPSAALRCCSVHPDS
jgi:hypothetical protein